MSPTRVFASTLQGAGDHGDRALDRVRRHPDAQHLKHTGAITAIRGGFTNISPDRHPGHHHRLVLRRLYRRASGFGTQPPSPRRLLVAIGFPALAAVLFRHDDPVHPGVFGAVGTPIPVGINRGWITRP